MHFTLIPPVSLCLLLAVSLVHAQGTPPRPPTQCPNPGAGATMAVCPLIISELGGNYPRCCHTHTACYRRCGVSKSACDDAFQACMVEACVRVTRREGGREECSKAWSWGGGVEENMRISMAEDFSCDSWSAHQEASSCPGPEEDDDSSKEVSYSRSSSMGPKPHGVNPGIEDWVPAFIPIGWLDPKDQPLPPPDAVVEPDYEDEVNNEYE